MSETSRTLSKAEAKIILGLEWRAQKIVTSAELRSLLGGSESHAKFLAHRLVQKGWLERIKRGVFQLVPADRGPEGVSDTNVLATGAVLVSPYFYSFGTACTHYGFTEQVFREVYVACRVARRPLTVKGTRFVFVREPDSRFFGFLDVEVLGERVSMASEERALLDAVDRPQFAGGLTEVSRIVANASRAISWPKLVDAARSWHESAVVQRLGYLLELHQVPIPPVSKRRLLALVKPTSKVHVGARATWGTRGRLVLPWGIVENVPRERLLEDGNQRRKRSFPGRPQ